MNKFDDTIEWLSKQMANAAESLRDLRSGRKIFLNGQDVTEEWVSTYERIIDQSKRLIAAYRSSRE